MSEYGIIMPFLDPSSSFCFGFECGQIWEQLKSGKRLEQYLCHFENKAQIEMMLKRFQYKYSFEIIEYDWMYLTAELDLSLVN